MNKDIFDEVFGGALSPTVPAQAPEPAPSVAGDASTKVARNLDLALDRQEEIVSRPITDETAPRDKRLIADVAHQIVKTAVQVDTNRLQARKDDVLERILVAIAQEKQRRGHTLGPEDYRRLEAAAANCDEPVKK